MKKCNQFTRYIFSLILLTMLITSCKVIKESRYAEYNVVDRGFLQYFSNDSLEFEIDFKGGHSILNPPLKNFKKNISPDILKFLKKNLQFTLHPSILIYSHSDWKWFGYEYIGFIRDKTPLNDVVTKFSDTQSEFFEVNRMERVGDFFLKKYIVPLSNHDLVMYCFNKILSDTKTDSLILMNTSLSELMSLKSNEIYAHRKGEKSLIDSAIELSNLPGYGTPLNRLRKLKNETTNKQESQLIGQFLYTVYANLDEIDTIKQLLFEQHTFKGNIRAPQSGDTLEVHNQLALNKVFEAAGKRKILMINESHYDWRHRYFVNLLLDSLYKIGYRYLAMEALENDGKVLNGDYLVTTKTGYYFKEPFMANLARSALKKRYSLVPYEDVTTEKDVERFNSSVDKREYITRL